MYTEAGCHEVISHSLSSYRYVQLERDGRRYQLHREIYEQHHGPIPPGMVVRHICDNPACINPGHLRIGTQADNVADMHARRRQADRRGEAHGEAKLTDAAVRHIRRREMTGRAYAALYGVSESAVSLVLRGKAWTHVEGE